MKVAEARRAHWSSAGGRGLDATKLFTVPAGTPEHTMRLTEFKKTLPDMEVDTVERVENGYQHEAFSVHAKSIAAKYGTGYDEATMRRLLFHGASASTQHLLGRVHRQGRVWLQDAALRHGDRRHLGRGYL